MRQLLPEPARSLDGRADLEEAYAAAEQQVLRANFVASLDGAVEIDGHSAGLGGPTDMAVFATLRALADVVLVGASTVRLENYGPARVKPEARDRRAGRGQPPLPTVAVVTASAYLDPASRLFAEPVPGLTPPRPVVLTCERAPLERRRNLARVAEVVTCGDVSVDLPEALAALRARGLAQVICEGGPTLFTSLVAAGLVDELCLSRSPVLAGAGRRSLLAPVKPPGADVAGQGDAARQGDSVAQSAGVPPAAGGPGEVVGSGEGGAPGEVAGGGASGEAPGGGESAGQRREIAGVGAPWDEPSRWRLVFLGAEDGMLFTRYRSCPAEVVVR